MDMNSVVVMLVFSFVFFQFPDLMLKRFYRSIACLFREFDIKSSSNLQISARSRFPCLHRKFGFFPAQLSFTSLSSLQILG